MLWKNRRESGNVEDQRRMGKGTMGIGGLAIGAIVVYLMGGNPLQFLMQNAGQLQTSSGASEQVIQQTEESKQFASVVLADTEDVWNEIFQKAGQKYEEPKMVLFSGSVQSACGRGSSAMGPFYCPGDHKVYLDLTFFDQLSGSLGAAGDFASAYVIAHEVGHHVQNISGLDNMFRKLKQGGNETRANQVSVVQELQADCLAGVWANRTENEKKVIEAGDIEEAMNAASAVGDDRLQKRSQGEVVPDSFTHGTSAQRVQAFRQGYDSGQYETCVNSYKL